MNIGKTIYVVSRKQWRSWLAKNHDKEKEIWLIYCRKSSGKPRIPYNDAVEEALCYGWIDSTVKKVDEERFAQRFTPRNSKSSLSQANKERICRLIGQKKMTAFGLAAVRHVFDESECNAKLKIAPDILNALKQDKKTWENFQEFPESYKRIRIGWIESARARPEFFKTRLRYFLKMTAKNKKYGMVQ
ncbi:MAG: YdeI/OmpD-associated family protein [Candidatus Woesearchaeota archaeon]